MGQPKRATSAAVAKPATAAPSEKPKNIVITTVARLRCGAYSAVSAMASGMAPPRPSPVRKRHAISPRTVCALGVSSMQSPKKARQTTITRLRPTRSATMPKASAPSIRPISPLTTTGVIAAGAICSDRAIAGRT
jgi:hypothetical protein